MFLPACKALLPDMIKKGIILHNHGRETECNLMQCNNDLLLT